MAQWLPDYVTDDLLRDQAALWFRTILFVAAFEVILILILGLFFSHRIAGPLYAMSLRFKDMARGEVPLPVYLRKSDLLTSFATQMNEAIAAMQTRREELNTALREADAGNLDAVRKRLRKLMEPTPALEPAAPDDERLQH